MFVYLDSSPSMPSPGNLQKVWRKAWMHWPWRKLRRHHARGAVACAELCGPGFTANRSQLPVSLPLRPLPFCQHLKGIIKILVHSLTVPGKALPRLVSRLLLLSQISEDIGIATW